MATLCRRCGQPIPEGKYGWCSCDVRGFRAACPTLSLPSGLTVGAVVMKRSGKKLTLEQALVGRLIYAETHGHDFCVYFLNSGVTVEIAPEVSSNPRPGPNVPNYVKG